MGGYSRVGAYKLLGLSGCMGGFSRWALIRRWALNRLKYGNGISSPS